MVGATVVVVLVVVLVVVELVDGGANGNGGSVVSGWLTVHDDNANREMMMIRRKTYLRDRQSRPGPSRLRVVSASPILLNGAVVSSHGR